MTETKPHVTPRGLTALVILAAVYGLTIVLSRYLSKGLGVYEQWYLRYGIAFGVGALVFYRQISWRKFLNLPRREWMILLFRVLIGHVIAIGIYTLAIERTKVALMAFMEVLPMSSVVGIILFREKLPPSQAFALALSFVGAAVVVVGRPHDLLSINFGAFLAFISIVLYALSMVTRRWHSDLLNNHELTIAISGLGAVIQYGLSVALYHRWMIPHGHWHMNFTLVLVLAGCLNLVMYFCSNYGFEHVNTVIAGNILSLEEIFGPLFGWLVYSEVVGLRDVIGGLIILFSIILMNQLVRRRRSVAIELVTVPD